MKELSKSIVRRLGDSNFIRKYFVGEGVDIGGKPDPLALYAELFPLMASVRTWDWEDGDAQYLEGVADESLDFVHSSHCIEHLRDPFEGLKNWLRVVKPGGYVILLLPDEDLYEQGVFPSTFNRDHKKTFTIHKQKSWSDQSINVIDLVREIGPSARVEKIELLTATQRFSLPRYDQTMTPIADSAIEVIIRKASAKEVDTGQRERGTEQPDPFLRRHYNQYRLDSDTIRRNNPDQPPFLDTSELKS